MKSSLQKQIPDSWCGIPKKYHPKNIRSESSRFSFFEIFLKTTSTTWSLNLRKGHVFTIPKTSLWITCLRQSFRLSGCKLNSGPEYALHAYIEVNSGGMDGKMWRKSSPKNSAGCFFLTLLYGRKKIKKNKKKKKQAALLFFWVRFIEVSFKKLWRQSWYCKHLCESIGCFSRERRNESSS